MADAKIRIQGDVSGFTDSMQQAERSVDGFSVSLGKVDKNANSLKAAMKTATKQAQDLAFQLSKMSDVELQSDFGQQLQAQFQTAMKAAADLKDQFGDVNQEIKNLASDTTGLDAMKEGVGVLSSGLSGLASVYGLVGGNTEEFAKALVAVNAIQNISNTITGIANALQKQSALADRRNARPQRSHGERGAFHEGLPQR
jgi:DNA repair ATPase RecN